MPTLERSPAHQLNHDVERTKNRCIKVAVRRSVRREHGIGMRTRVDEVLVSACMVHCLLLCVRERYPPLVYTLEKLVHHHQAGSASFS